MQYQTINYFKQALAIVARPELEVIFLLYLKMYSISFENTINQNISEEEWENSL